MKHYIGYKMLRRLTTNYYDRLDETKMRNYYFKTEKAKCVQHKDSYEFFVKLTDFWHQLNEIDYETFLLVVNKLSKRKNVKKNKLDKLYELIKKDDINNTKGIANIISYVYSNNLFNENNYLLAVFLINLKRKSQNMYPYIFLENRHQIKYIIQIKDKNRLLEIIERNIEHNKTLIDPKFNIVYDLSSIQKLIKQNRDYIVNNLTINDIYIFGSYARGDANILSDIDLYIRTDNISNQNYYETKRFFTEIFNKEVDITIEKRKFNKHFLKNIEKDFIKIH